MWWRVPLPVAFLRQRPCRAIRCPVGAINSAADRLPEAEREQQIRHQSVVETTKRDSAGFCLRFSLTCRPIAPSLHANSARIATEGAMRVVVAVIAALVTLGLAAFGVVAAQHA